MKRTLKRLLIHMGVRALEAPTFERFHRNATRNQRARALAKLAQEFGVKRMVAEGRFGEITSDVADTTVFLSYAEDGVWAAATNKLVEDFFGDNGFEGTYVDIGANIGLTTIPIAKNSKIKCYCFEPETRNFGNLSRNISSNIRTSNVQLFQLAVSDRESMLEFEVTEGNLGDQRIKGGSLGPSLLGEADRRSITVEARALDDMGLQLADPLAVKIDVQGAEPFVIAGGRRSLSKAALLVLEYWPYGMGRLEAPVEILFSFLEQQFGSLELVFKEGASSSPPAPVNDVIPELRRYYEEHKLNPSFYLDIIARKSSQKAGA
ncbi:FkbM family methyltransferase [Phenylobacterium sp.]|uniref:FkbM family methyltransferase n=1 Tax=Phenylobacterium sp. TaxID=1871053 RepID=UPI002F3F238D